MATTFFPTMHLDWRKGGLKREGALLKEVGGAVDQPGGGCFCVARLHTRSPTTHARFRFFHLLTLRSISAGARCRARPVFALHESGCVVA